MQKVSNNIYIGKAIEAYGLEKNAWSLLGVTNTYHYFVHDWVRGGKYSDDPCYIIHEEPGLMSVNWVDAAARFFDYQGKGVENFKRILDFIEKQEKPVFIFCDQGISRSPSVAMVHLAKRLKVIPDTFSEAIEAFLELYPTYAPGGIADFLAEKWEEIK